MKGKEQLNFIEQIIENDLKNDHNKDELCFRFPPEPNGFLHIGHVKAISLNFSLGKKYNAPVNLRFDDTNPVKENYEYVSAIKKDILWLGYKWKNECFASDYFEKLYEWALGLIKNSKAYIDSQDSNKIAQQKGTTTLAGTNSPYRNRPIKENLKIFQEMKEGKHPEGSHVLRAKIDMNSPNLLMRDPVLYRVLFKEHHRTKKTWCIYPLYDWAHGESDYIEKITHSLCTLEFKPHRELYNWFLNELPTLKHKKPKQIEFARLNMSFTVTSKRKLSELVKENHVSGWDDPRMPTISGLRRRGYPPEALINFVKKAGISKRENTIDFSLLEFYVREALNKTAPRVMAVLNPVKLIITNYPTNKEEYLEAENNPENKSQGTRKIRFSKSILIEKEDFQEAFSEKFFRLSIGKEVRLKNAYIIKANSLKKDKSGSITEIYCSYDPQSKSGSGTVQSKRKVKGTIHWVSEKHCFDIEVNLYDRLFNTEAPDRNKDRAFTQFINKESFVKINAKAEESLVSAMEGDIFQFQRMGYFVVDKESRKEKTIFNKTVGLRDNWTKKERG